MESTENLKECFIFPSIEKEIGEIKRVAEQFEKEDKEKFILQFIENTKTSQLDELTDENWNKLENTDSIDITLGDWDKVNYHASSENRDWQTLKLKIEQGEKLDAPIIIKVGNILHLVSENTRLMVAKALGIRPKVLIVDMN